MASVPNMRAAPIPAPAGKPPAAAADPAAFARRISEIPEELVRLAAAILSGDGGETPAPDGKASDGGDDAAADAADAPSDAAQLAALAPLLQSLPAIVAVPVTAPATSLAPEIQLKIETTAAATPSPNAPPPAPAPAGTGKTKQVKAEAKSDETGGDDGGEEPTSALDAAAKEAIATAKRVIEARLRAAKPAIAEAAPKAVRAAASALNIVREALPPALAPETRALTADIAASAALAVPAAPAPTPSTSAQPREVAGPAADRTLDLANDAEWLDRLARDIAQASGNEGTIRFRLHPQTLGHLRVELSQGDHGTSIRLTADNEQARAILADAQPRLVAEARAQGVRIAETHVDLSGLDRHFSGEPRRQDDHRLTPMIRTAGDAAADADAPERPGRSRSDRYA
jgi:flagellar hook-length control protein FliK